MKQMTNQEAHEYLAKMRWGNKVICPYCESKRITKRKRAEQRPYICGACNKSFSATTKTVFQSIKKLSSVLELIALMQTDLEMNVNRASQITKQCRAAIRLNMNKLLAIGIKTAKPRKVGRPETDFPAQFSYNKSMRDHLANNPQ